MPSENIQANQITPDWLGVLPSSEIVSFSAGDYNQDGVVTTIEEKVDRRGKLYTKSGGRQGVDWQYADLPEGQYGSFFRRILAQKDSSGLVWDSGLQGYSTQNRIAIVEDVNSGDWDGVKWDILYAVEEVQGWVQYPTQEIPVAQVWVDAWADFKAGNLVEQIGEDGNWFSDEKKEARRQEGIAAREALEAKEEADRLAAIEAEEQRQAEELAALKEQETEWSVVESTTIPWPAEAVTKIAELKLQYETSQTDGSGLAAVNFETWNRFRELYTFSSNASGGTGYILSINNNDSAPVYVDLGTRKILKNGKIITRYAVFTNQNPEEKFDEGNIVPRYHGTLESAMSAYTKQVAYVEKEMGIMSEISQSFEERVTSIYEWRWGNDSSNIHDIIHASVGGVSDLTSSYYTYSKSVSFIDDNRTMVLRDTDGVDVTDVGFEYAPSGSLSFTVAKGVKMHVQVSVKTGGTSAVTNWISRPTKSQISGVTKSGNAFSMWMYGGDRLEIDVDNEQEGLNNIAYQTIANEPRTGRRPFFITVKGKEWYIEEEPDTEMRITINSIKRLEWKEKQVVQIYANDKLLSEKITEGDTLGWQPFYNAPEEAIASITDPDMLESLETRTFVSPTPEAEDSFIDPTEAVDIITPDLGIENPFTNPNLKWWLIGGAVVIGGFVLLAVFINARGRRTVTSTVQ